MIRDANASPSTTQRKCSLAQFLLSPYATSLHFVRVRPSDHVWRPLEVQELLQVANDTSVERVAISSVGFLEVTVAEVIGVLVGGHVH